MAQTLNTGIVLRNDSSQAWETVKDSAILLQVHKANFCPDVGSPFELLCTFPKFEESKLASQNDHICGHYINNKH